jgi:hypothetical protein
MGQLQASMMVAFIDQSGVCAAAAGTAAAAGGGSAARDAVAMARQRMNDAQKARREKFMIPPYGARKYRKLRGDRLQQETGGGGVVFP